MQRLLKKLLIVALVITPIAWFFKGRLVDREQIRPELSRDPIQEPTVAEPFTFVYKGKEARVRPVADYELWGLVVSHNNIKSVADMYHDSPSVDTKDLCVIWGANLQSDDYQRVNFRSGSFTCYYRYPAGVRFRSRAASNNHLIADNDQIRRQIADVKVGDQVRLKGLLVDYQVEDWHDFWRKSSTVRTDSGCEVLFVEEVEVLQAGTPVWYLAYRFGWLALVGLPVLYLLSLHFGVRGS
jgi:hypothetical protein